MATRHSIYAYGMELETYLALDSVLLIKQMVTRTHTDDHFSESTVTIEL